MRQKPIKKNLEKKTVENVFKTFQLRSKRKALILLVANT